MSSLQYAYSEELKNVISVEEAYELFWKGSLHDKSAFQCPGNNCDAKITCACMDIKETELRQTPNFRVYGKHSDDCEYLKFIDDENKQTYGNGAQVITQTNCMELILTRNNNEQVKPLKQAEQVYQNKAHKVIGGYGKYSSRPKVYTIRPIVEKYFEYREDETLDTNFIKIDSEYIDYKKLFKGVFNQDVIELTDEKRIFWGLCFINKAKNGSYQIRFVKSFKYQGKDYRPSFFISQIDFNNYEMKKRLQMYINDDSVKSKVRHFVFIYGNKPIIKRYNNNIYINFIADNLDFVDFRGQEYFDRLKK